MDKTSFIDADTQKQINAPLNGTLIHGTHRMCDLIPAMLEAIRDTAEYAQLSSRLPSVVTDPGASEWDDRWQDEDVTYLYEELTDILERYAPEGYYFGIHPGDGSDFGYWSDESYMLGVITESVKGEQLFILDNDQELTCSTGYAGVPKVINAHQLNIQQGNVMVGDKFHMVNINDLDEDSVKKLFVSVKESITNNIINDKPVLVPFTEEQWKIMSDMGYPYAPGNEKAHEFAKIPDMIYWRLAAGFISFKDAVRAFNTTGYTVGENPQRTREVLSELNSQYGKLDGNLRPILNKTESSTLTPIEKEVIGSIVRGNGNLPDKMEGEEYKIIFGEVCGAEMAAMKCQPLADRQREILLEESKHFDGGIEELAMELHVDADYLKATLSEHKFLDNKPYSITLGTDNRPGGVEGEYHLQFKPDIMNITFCEQEEVAKEFGGTMRVTNGQEWADFYHEADAIKFAEKVIGMNQEREAIKRNAVNEKEDSFIQKELDREKALKAIGYPYDHGRRADGSYNIPTLDESLYWDYAAGIIDLHDAAREFCKNGWTNFVDEKYTLKKFGEINKEFGKLDADLKPLVNHQEDDGKKVDVKLREARGHLKDVISQALSEMDGHVEMEHTELSSITPKGDWKNEGNGHVFMELIKGDHNVQDAMFHDVHAEQYSLDDVISKLDLSEVNALTQAVQEARMANLFERYQSADMGNGTQFWPDKGVLGTYQAFAFKDDNILIFKDADSEGVRLSSLPHEEQQCAIDAIGTLLDKHLASTAAKQVIHDRIVTPTARSFTPDQVDTLTRYRAMFTTDTDTKELFTRLYEDVIKDPEVARKPEKWKTDTLRELNDLAEGIIRDEARGLHK